MTPALHLVLQASLPKAFAEDKGMRPRVWVPPEVNKPHGNLTTEDIQVHQ
jgi:hypothetical protein